MSRTKAIETVIEAVETLPSDAHGMLIYGTDASSSVVVMVARRQICWAVATASSRRLPDILEARGVLPRGRAAQSWLYGLCKRRSIWFGEWLVSRGVVSQATLESALAEQAREALSFVTPEMGEPLWLPVESTRAPSYRVAVDALHDDYQWPSLWSASA